MSLENSPLPAITAPNLSLPEDAAPAFDAIGVARKLLRSGTVAALATLDPASGFPLATLVTYVPDVDGAPLFFLSGLSLHTRNMKSNHRISVLITQSGKGDPLAHPRLSLVGACTSGTKAESKDRFVTFLPKTMLYAELPDFSVWRMEIEMAHLNGGFARAQMVSGRELTCDAALNSDFIAHQRELLQQAREDYVDMIAAKFSTPVDQIDILSIDPDGVDVRAGGLRQRLQFSSRQATAAMAMEALAGTLRAVYSLRKT